MPLLRVTPASVWQSWPQQVPSVISNSHARSFLTGNRPLGSVLCW